EDSDGQGPGRTKKTVTGGRMIRDCRPAASRRQQVASHAGRHRGRAQHIRRDDEDEAVGHRLSVAASRRNARSAKVSSPVNAWPETFGTRGKHPRASSVDSPLSRYRPYVRARSGPSVPPPASAGPAL